MVPTAVPPTAHPPRAGTVRNTMHATCASGTDRGTVYTPIAQSRYRLRCHAQALLPPVLGDRLRLQLGEDDDATRRTQEYLDDWAKEEE